MERVYLLLRNNVQSGPFTIGELLQQPLTPSDMVWIEGRSTAWTYLYELELAPSVAKMPETEKENEITGKDEIERKAEELRKKILSSPPRHFPSIAVEKETHSSPYKLPEDDIHFTDHRKERKTIVGELAVTCFVIGLFAVGVYKGREFLSERKTVLNPAATKLVTNDQHAAGKNNEETMPPVSLIDSSGKERAVTMVKWKPKATIKKPADSNQALNSTAAILPLPVQPQDNNTGEKIVNNPTEKPQPAVKLPEEIPVKKETIIPPVKKEKARVNEKPRMNEEKEERKGFLKGLFKKKKKEEN